MSHSESKERSPATRPPHRPARSHRPAGSHTRARRTPSDSVPAAAARPVSTTHEGARTRQLWTRDRRGSWSSWGISATLHLLFLLAIAMLQLGLRGVTESLEFAAAPVDIDSRLVYVAPAQKTAEPQAVAIGSSAILEIDEPALLQVENPLDVIALPGEAEIGPQTRFGLEETATSAGASFFGAQAAGDRFVYILDVSPSMNHRQGQRLERAVLELLRSIDQLRAEQAFYVMVFGWQTRRMFDDDAPQPRLVPATLPNKTQLRDWLAELKTITGTDPRAAIDLALRIRPSAIFLLSDGEFNRPQRGGYTPLGRRVIDVVRRARPHLVPIHAVTFEDPAGGRAMDRLAEESDGSSRFVSAPPGESVRSRGRGLRYQIWPNFRRVVSRFTFHEENGDKSS